MKLTRKKKAIIASAAIRDMQILGTAIIQYKSIAVENKALIRDTYGEDLIKAMYNIFANVNFMNNVLNEMYKDDKRSAKFLKDCNGLTHIEEMSSQVIDKMNEVIATYKV